MHVRVSHHAGQRMNQRGISRRLVDFALRLRPRRGQQAHPRPQRVAPRHRCAHGGAAARQAGARQGRYRRRRGRRHARDHLQPGHACPPAERRARPCLKHYSPAPAWRSASRHRFRRRLGARRQDARRARGAASARRGARESRGRQARARRQHASRARRAVQSALRRSARQHEPNVPAARHRPARAVPRARAERSQGSGSRPSTRSCSRSKSR